MTLPSIVVAEWSCAVAAALALFTALNGNLLICRDSPHLFAELP